MNSGEDCDTRKNDNNPLLKPARYKAAYGGRGSATTRKPKFDRLLPTVPQAQRNAPGGSLRRCQCSGGTLMALTTVRILEQGHRHPQAYLGHRSIQSTVRYTELAPGRFKILWR